MEGYIELESTDEILNINVNYIVFVSYDDIHNKIQIKLANDEECFYISNSTKENYYKILKEIENTKIKKSLVFDHES